jgi:hypothetical protein
LPEDHGWVSFHCPERSFYPDAVELLNFQPNAVFLAWRPGGVKRKLLKNLHLRRAAVHAEDAGINKSGSESLLSGQSGGRRFIIGGDAFNAVPG